MPSLREMTRIAASDPVIWSDIFLSNRRNLVSAIRRYRVCLQRLEAMIASGSKTRLVKAIDLANRKRQKI